MIHITNAQTKKEEVHGGDRLPESARAFSGGGCQAPARQVYFVANLFRQILLSSIY